MCKIIPVANQKGGTLKTTSAVNLAVGLARHGKKVLLVDCDSQADATTSLGWRYHDSMEVTLATLMQKVLNGEEIKPQEGILQHNEGVFLLPSNIELAAMEMQLMLAMSRETVLKRCLQAIKTSFDYVILDCPPNLGMITINALAAADFVIIPVQAQYLPAKGMTQLLRTIGQVKHGINPDLDIAGILLTLVDNRTNLAKNSETTIREAYGDKIRIFDTKIPLGVKAAECSSTGKSIFRYSGNSNVALAYEALTKEVLGDVRQRRSKVRDSAR